MRKGCRGKLSAIVSVILIFIRKICRCHAPPSECKEGSITLPRSLLLFSHEIEDLLQIWRGENATRDQSASIYPTDDFKVHRRFLGHFVRPLIEQSEGRTFLLNVALGNLL